MERAIIGFSQDESGDWVALLDCGHRQHVRHAPPFVERPWVESVQGRAEMVGEKLSCRRCLDLELPDGFIAYRSTPLFTEKTVPAGLRRDHTTKTGVWGRIEISTGQLDYLVFGDRHRLDVGTPGNIPPEIPHRLVISEAVEFQVVFYHALTS